jgi:Chalcone isomerase-like
MRRFLFWLLVNLITALGVGAAHGKECKGASFPEQMPSEGGTLKLNGLGLRQATFLKVDVYVAALYVAETSGDPNAILNSNAPKELILHFVRDVGRADLGKGWDEGFENNASSQLPALKERIEAFKGLMADMNKGQRLRLVFKPGAGTRVDVSGTVKGAIAGDDFARALFSIWLGPRPPNAELKAGLLGGPCG